MEKFSEKLLLNYLILTIGPFLPYADQYGQYGIVKVKLYPIQASINTIVELQFDLWN